MESDCSAGWIAAAIIFAVAYWGSFFDDNKEAKHGEDFGLPINCRAYVQASVDGFRRGEYEVNETINGLERNCGANGNSWKNNRRIPPAALADTCRRA